MVTALNRAGMPVSAPQDWHQLGIVPGMAIQVFGMRRSGNHAILAWLQRNAPNARSVFFNNCKPGGNPLRNARGLEINGQRAPLGKARKDMAAVTAEAGDGALFLASFEDTSPAEFNADRSVCGDFDQGLFGATVLIYRSFLNWAASLLKKMQPNDSFSLVRRNAILLRAIDTYTRLLAYLRQTQDPAITSICYDRWVSDEDYRAQLLRDLGLAQRDNSLGEVQSYGGGSSFQKQAQCPDELETDRRWQQMSDDPEYQAVLHLAARDPALMQELEQLFPSDAAYLKTVGAQAPMPQGVAPC